MLSETPNLELMMNQPFSLSLESALGPFGTHNTSLLLHNKHRMIPNPVNIPWKENSWSMKAKLEHMFRDNIRLDASFDYSKPQCFWLEYET